MVEAKVGDGVVVRIHVLDIVPVLACMHACMQKSGRWHARLVAVAESIKACLAAGSQHRTLLSLTRRTRSPNM